MKLSPLEIRKQEFNRVMRGYDADEVRAFLTNVANQMDELIVEQERSENALAEHKSKMGHLEDVQEALQATLNTARQNAEETRQTAIKKAEIIIHEAHLKSEEILKKAERDIEKLRSDITELQTKRDQILAKIKSVLNAELDMLKSFQPEEVEDHKESGVEVAALEYIDPKARAYKEELLAKARAAAARESGSNESSKDGVGESGSDESEGDDEVDHVGETSAPSGEAEASEKDGAVGAAQDVAEVVASLKASVGESDESSNKSDDDAQDQEEIKKIRRILDDLE
jgi:cell division initiation protein